MTTPVADLATRPVRSQPGAVTAGRRPDGTWRRAVGLAVAELRDPRLYQIAVLSGLAPRLRRQRLDLEVAARPGGAPCWSRCCSPSTPAPGSGSCRALRPAERPDLGPLALPAAAHQRRSPWPCVAAVDRDREQVRAALAGQARLQPDQLRARGHDARSPGQVWVSPGQWGSVAFFGFLIACLGGLVVNRAARSDVTFAFLGVLRRDPLRPRALAGPAAGDPAPPARRTAPSCSSPSS